MYSRILAFNELSDIENVQHPIFHYFWPVKFGCDFLTLGTFALAEARTRSMEPCLCNCFPLSGTNSNLNCFTHDLLQLQETLAKSFWPH